jgi:DNA (cytosine-5)-methyltransferase 1
MGTEGKKSAGTRDKRHGLTVVELFAGVGGFRLGLETRGSWRVVWSNQWEPSRNNQFASDCYVKNFKPGTNEHCNEDIEKVLATPNEPGHDIPDHKLLVAGFPCQDYSVAKPLNQALGIEGKKGILWWSIYEILRRKRPPFVLLENVDRLLKSPVARRGRDFAVILSCLQALGYMAEWRVVNAAEYGFPQKRRRVFIFAALEKLYPNLSKPFERVYKAGVLARALRVEPPSQGLLSGQPMSPKPDEVSAEFALEGGKSVFENAGILYGGNFYTARLTVSPQESKRGKGPHTLGDVVKRTKVAEVSHSFFISETELLKWKYLKGAKGKGTPEAARIHARGFSYEYNEGAMAFPDPLESAARTILTGEGGKTPSRFKHAIQWKGALRRLIPEELEELNGFPRGWTDTGMSDGQRAFCMGNALVVGIVERIGKEIAKEVKRKASEIQKLEEHVVTRAISAS